MDVRKRLLCALALLVALISIPLQVLACACCADPGEYHISFDKPSEYQLAMMDNIQFGSAAHLYTTEADIEETAKGIISPVENYALVGSFAGKVWRLTFRDGNKQGTLILPFPEKMLSYRADTHESANGSMVWLNKEWRFEGGVSGTGIFRAGIVGATKYSLVFQGRGNNCDDGSDFTHWHLEISGRKARYALYGELKRETIVTKHAKGTFEVKMTPMAAEENVGDATIGRMSIEKKIEGDLVATSKAQMLASMSEVQGSAGYVAIERVTGTLDGRKGTFALQHSGLMNRGAPNLVITVIPDSGTGGLVGLTGTMTIEIVEGKHFYDFEYTINKHD